MSSAAKTLGSWVWIPLEARMAVGVSSVSVSRKRPCDRTYLLFKNSYQLSVRTMVPYKSLWVDYYSSDGSSTSITVSFSTPSHHFTCYYIGRPIYWWYSQFIRNFYWTILDLRFPRRSRSLWSVRSSRLCAALLLASSSGPLDRLFTASPSPPL
jgi:hypothetical protein